MSKRRQAKLPKEPLATTITSLSHDGRGIASINGKTTFISYALPDEEIDFIYTAKHGKYDEGQMTKVHKSSPHRVAAKCQHFGVCGGCCLQHLDPQQQILLKQQTLLEQLQHFGNVEPEEILAPLTGSIWNYRHKARLGVRYVAKKEKVLIGFRETNGRYIADIQYCEILHSSVAALFTPLQNLISKLSIYNEIPQIEVAVGDTITVLIFRHLKPCSNEDKTLIIEFANTHKLRIYLQSKGLDTTFLFADGVSAAEKNHSELLEYNFPEYQIKFLFHPQDFSQVNIEINRQMIQRAIDLLQPNKQDKILDLFCGFGNFTLPLARQCENIIGIEGNHIAVERAKYNAEVNKIYNAQFYCADLIQNMVSANWAQQTFSKILLDPPRTGALEIIQNIDRFKAQSILYISCNPATLARDAGELVHRHHYRLRKAGVMDMFPHTAHVESIALFEKI